jgi:hypothetical protein
MGLIILGLLILAGGGAYFILDFSTPALPAEINPPTLTIPTAVILTTPTQLPTSTPTPIPTPTATPTSEEPTDAEAALPPGGIIYVVTPDINSVGSVRAGEPGNHFGESYVYAGVREGALYHGAMQFDLSFLQDGSTIFFAELELTGLADEGLTNDSSFEVSILTKELDEGWSRHGFEVIQSAGIEERLSPVLRASDLGLGQANQLVFNAAQRSIIEDRLESDLISFRVDSLFPEGWFAWDSGYGSETQGQAPKLRIGVLPPPATEAAAAPPPDSTPTPTPTFVIITSTPTPENILTAVPIALRLTAEATTTGTATPLPANWVTPIVVTATPTPENTVTAIYQQIEATAAVLVAGTSTPIPQNLMTATPTPTETATPIFILLEGELPPLTPTPTVSVTPEPTPTVPTELIGKIAFKSDRTGQEEIYVINPDGSGLALLTNRWPYNMANLADAFSADGRYRVFTKNIIRYENVDQGNGEAIGVKNEVPAIFWYDSLDKIEQQVTHFGTGVAYGGVWSPTTDQIAFISNDSSDDEIWMVNRDGSNLLRLTDTNEAYNAREIGKDTFLPELNGHPSWSPDGTKIAFWSNRTGHGQIFVMDANGQNLYSLSRTGFNDWDPVWIKYPGIPANAHEVHMPYAGRFNLWVIPGPTCKDFANRGEAQSFYMAAGGPYKDPHQLDANQNGFACDEN